MAMLFHPLGTLTPLFLSYPLPPVPTVLLMWNQSPKDIAERDMLEHLHKAESFMTSYADIGS